MALWRTHTRDNDILFNSFPFYFYKRDDAKKIPNAIADGCGIDAPGSFVAWLCKNAVVHAMEMPGKRYDIGNLESYEKVQKEYKGIC